jgi:hypothetical protein
LTTLLNFIMLKFNMSVEIEETKAKLVTKSVCIPQDLLTLAEDAAKADRRTFSSYVQKLIDDNIKGRINPEKTTP